MPMKARTTTSPSLPTPESQAKDPTQPITFTDGLPLPKVIVFDLDYTLWPFWCDTHISPPVRPLPTSHASHGVKVKDTHGGSFAFYSDVPAVLRACKEKGITLGIASRSHTPDIAQDLLTHLQIPAAAAGGASDGAGAGGMTKAMAFFASLQIYPGNKTGHLRKISRALGVGFEDMLFFDDEERNRNVERELGVCFTLVRNGVSRAEIDRGVERWRKAKGEGGKEGGKKKADGRGVDVVIDGQSSDEESL